MSQYNSNIDLERAVLHTIMTDPERFYDVSGYLTSGHFSVTQHEMIFKKIENLVDRGADPGYVLIVSDLDSSGELQTVGGKEYLDDLYNEEYADIDLKAAADRIIKGYMVRSARTLGYNLMQLGKDDQENIESYLSQITSQLSSLVGGSSASFTEHIQSILREEWDELKSRFEQPGISGVSTGLTEFDIVTSGLVPTDLVLIASRPSMGKTTLLIRQLLNVAKKNIPVLLFSYEMSKKQLSQRMVSMESRIGLQNIRTGTVTNEQLESIKDTYLDVSNYPIYIDTNMSASLGYVLSTIRRVVNTNGVKVVFIDYIQLLSRSTENETTELGRISRALKMLAMELGITIVVASQLNRLVESRDNKRPILSDLRQSGTLEEDADIVTMLYRPAYYEPQLDDKQNLLELLIRKNRNGPTGTINVYFEPESVNIINSLAELINNGK